MFSILKYPNATLYGHHDNRWEQWKNGNALNCFHWISGGNVWQNMWYGWNLTEEQEPDMIDGKK